MPVLMVLSRDDVAFLISALDALNSDWLAGAKEVGATKDPRAEAAIRHQLLDSLATMIHNAQLGRIEVRLLASMLAAKLREELAKTVQP